MLIWLASTQTPEQSWPLVETLSTWTIKKLDVAMVEEEPSWMNKILHYKKDRTLPIDLVATRRVKHYQVWYCLINDHLFRKSFS